MKPIVNKLVSNLNWLKEKGLFHPDVVIDSLASPVLDIDRQKYVSFCSNNYLGLGQRPEVIAAAKDALLKYSDGTSESRKLGGNLTILEELEDVISDYKHKEDTILFATGLLANVGVISAITDINFYMNFFYQRNLPSDDVVILGDKLNHRSIQMGVKLSKAHYVKYDHLNMEDLEKKILENKSHNLFIVTDSVFSMDGDMAPLDQITALANHYNAAVMIDDAHASGIYGIEGRGAAEHFSVTKDIDFLMGTLSKAFGAIGGFVSGKKDLIDMLKVNTSTYYFTSSLPASEAGALIKSISIAKNEPGLRKKLWTNVYRLLKGLLGIGLEFPLRFSQIIPIMVYEEKVAFQLEDFLYKKGVLCSAVTVPAVAPNMARLRVSVNATHTDEHIDMLLNVLSEAASLFNLPKKAYSKKDWEIFLAQTPKYILQLIDINKGN